MTLGYFLILKKETWGPLQLLSAYDPPPALCFAASPSLLENKRNGFVTEANPTIKLAEPNSLKTERSICFRLINSGWRKLLINFCLPLPIVSMLGILPGSC